MKKLAISAIILVLLASFAPIPAQTAPLERRNARFIENGEVLSESLPIAIVDGNILVPWDMFFWTTAVEPWNAETGRISIYAPPQHTGAHDVFNIVFTLNEDNFTINEIPQTAATAPQLVDGEPFVPLQSLLAPYGVSVEWDEPTNTVIMRYTRFLGRMGDLTEPFLDENLVPSHIIDGRILVPWAFLADRQLDTFNAETGQLTITAPVFSLDMVFMLNENYFTINGERFSLEVPAQMIFGAPFLPFRAFVEGLNSLNDFDISVEWDGETQTVYAVVDGTPPTVDWQAETAPTFSERAFSVEEYDMFIIYTIVQSVEMQARRLSAEFMQLRQTLRRFEISEILPQESWQDEEIWLLQETLVADIENALHEIGLIKAEITRLWEITPNVPWAWQNLSEETLQNWETAIFLTNEFIQFAEETLLKAEGAITGTVNLFDFSDLPTFEESFEIRNAALQALLDLSLEIADYMPTVREHHLFEIYNLSRGIERLLWASLDMLIWAFSENELGELGEFDELDEIGRFRTHIDLIISRISEILDDNELRALRHIHLPTELLLMQTRINESFARLWASRTAPTANRAAWVLEYSSAISEISEYVWIMRQGIIWAIMTDSELPWDYFDLLE